VREPPAGGDRAAARESPGGATERPVREPPAGAERVQQYLTFVLGSETFAIGILAIKEIIEYANLTAVPMMPPYRGGGSSTCAGRPYPCWTCQYVRQGKPAR